MLLGAAAAEYRQAGSEVRRRARLHVAATNQRVRGRAAALCPQKMCWLNERAGTQAGSVTLREAR